MGAARFRTRMTGQVFAPVRIAQLVGFVVIGVAYLFWSWSDQISDFGVDSAVYLLIAQHWSPWTIDSGPVAAVFAKQSQFPPLFPGVLAVFDAGNHVLRAHLITAGFLLAWLVAFYLWSRTLRLERWLASVLVLLLAMLPVSYLQVLHIHSENAYLFFSLAALFAVGKAEPRQDINWYVAAAALVGLAALTRAAGISLIAAFLLYISIRRPRGWPVLALISAVPFGLWLVLRSRSPDSYVGWLIKDFIADPIGPFMTIVQYMLPATRDGFLESFGISRSGFVVGHLLGLLATAGVVHRAILGKLDGYYSVAYLGVILLWPFPAQSHRFVFCILPVLLVQGLLLIQRVTSRFSLRASSAAVATWTYLLPLFVIAGLELAFHLNRYNLLSGHPEVADPRVSAAYKVVESTTAVRVARNYVTMRAAMRRVEETVPPTDCVLSIVPSVVSFYSGRLSVRLPQHFDDEGVFREQLNETGCHYALMINFKTPSFPEHLYPAARLWNDAKVRWTYPGGVPGDPPTAIMVGIQ